MSLRRTFSTALISALAALGLLSTSPASAETIWNLELHHNETNFPPGGVALYSVEIANVGTTDSAGPVTFTLALPKNMGRQSVHGYGALPPNWSCPGSPNDKVITCTTSRIFPAYSLERNLVIAVKIDAGASGQRTAAAKVSGGGAATEASAKELTTISPEEPGFGILAETFVPDFFKADGLTPEREAGAHPDLLTVPFDFTSIPNEETSPGVLQRVEDESVRNLITNLPPGFVGSTTAVGECTQAEFLDQGCPRGSQVGRIALTVRSGFPAQFFVFLRPLVYNLSHPRGVISDLAFYVAGNPIHIKVSLDPANRYAIRSVVPDINETLPPFNQKLTLWGIPADESHDFERCDGPTFSGDAEASEECGTDAPHKPFLSLPSQCEDDNVFRLHHYDSWQNTGVYGPELTYTLPGKMTDCHKPRFEPDVEIEPTGKQANTPTGLDVHIKVAQNENPNALATPPVKRTTVTLPEGMSFSPSFADGLKSCTLAQMKLGTNEPVQCPDASRIGEVELSTPLLPEEAVGSMFLAAQRDNPYDSTFALLLVLEDTEERGALIKIPGRIEVDEQTGQIKTIFDDLPQFPFDDLTLKFRSGPRAPLVTAASSPTTTATGTRK